MTTQPRTFKIAYFTLHLQREHWQSLVATTIDIRDKFAHAQLFTTYVFKFHRKCVYTNPECLMDMQTNAVWCSLGQFGVNSCFKARWFLLVGYFGELTCKIHQGMMIQIQKILFLSSLMFLFEWHMKTIFILYIYKSEGVNISNLFFPLGFSLWICLKQHNRVRDQIVIYS